jgi:hypothetical protein
MAYDVNINRGPQEGCDYINDILEFITEHYAGPTEPEASYRFPLMLWADTTTKILKLRNEANTAWLTVGSFDSTSFNFALKEGTQNYRLVVTDGSLAMEEVI